MILYKYMSLERKNFWTDYKLRFTQPSTFNDPFDCPLLIRLFQNS